MLMTFLFFSKNEISIIDITMKEYDLKGVGAQMYYLGSDVDMLNSNLAPKDLDGILEVGHDEKDKYLNVQWLRHNVKTAFSARTYIKNTIQRLERMMDKTFAQ